MDRDLWIERAVDDGVGDVLRFSAWGDLMMAVAFIGLPLALLTGLCALACGLAALLL